MVDLKLNAVITAGSERAMEYLDSLTKVAGDSVFSFDKMSTLLNDALTAVRNVSLGALTAFSGLALTSPTVQAALSRMKPALFEISETLGKSLKPGLDAFGTILKDVAGWLGENTWFTEALGGAFTTLAGIVSTLLKDFDKLSKYVVKPTIEFFMDIDLGEKLQKLVDNFGMGIIGALIGSKFGIAGAIAGFGFGMLLDKSIDNSTSLTDQPTTNTFLPGSVGMGGYGFGVPNINVFINRELVPADEVEVQ